MDWPPHEDFSSNGHNPDMHNGTGKRGRRGEKRTRTASPPAAPVFDYGFMPPPRPPSLGEAIRQLPQQYFRVTTKPWVETFLVEKGQASWGIVWVQLIGLAIITALLAYVKTLLAPASAGNASGVGVSSLSAVRAVTLSSTLGLVLLLPLLFFAATSVLFALARLGGGQGSFVQQAYTTLLFLTPFTLLVSVLGLLPFVGSFFSTFGGALLFVYGVILQCFATTAVHQLSGGRATAVTLVTALLLIPLSIAAVFLLSVLLVALSG